MRDIAITLIFVTFFCLWLIAELRGRRALRIILGLVCMVLLGAGIYVVVASAEIQLDMHRTALQRIHKRLDAGDIERVRRALTTYDDIDAQTGNSRYALLRALPILLGPDEGE